MLADSLALVNALCEAETLHALSDSLVDRLAEALVLADSDALAKALIDADVLRIHLRWLRLTYFPIRGELYKVPPIHKCLLWPVPSGKVVNLTE